MDYSKMTVAQLRELAEERGIDAPKGCKKAVLVGLLEADGPVEVEAEVIDPEPDAGGQLAVTFNAGQISANFDELERLVDGILDQYEGWEPSADVADDVAQCTRERKYLNGLAKQIDERRKEVKGKYLLPLNAFESRANAIRDKIKQVSARISSVEQEADDRRRSEKKEELQSHYEAYAGLLLDVVPYGKLHDERWLNKTFAIEKAKSELESKVDGIARDWNTLKSLGLEFHEDAEARFFDTLDVGGAIAWAGKLAEDKRRIEAMKAELAGAPAEPVQAEPVPAEPVHAKPVPAEPVRAVTVTVPAAPEEDKGRVIADIARQLEWYPLRKLENLRDALASARNAEGEAAQRVMVIDAATQGQLDVVGKFCGMVGVTGTFKNGTLADVVRRENAKAAQAAREGVLAYGA